MDHQGPRHKQGETLAPTLIYKSSDDANILTGEAWLDEDTIANATFTVKPARDNTAFAHRSNRDPSRNLAEQYVSAPCDINIRTSKGSESIPVLALTGVRILAQSSAKGQSGGYGTEFVRMAISSRYVETIRKGLASSVAVLDPPIEKSNKKTIGGTAYVTFTVNVAKCPVEIEEKPGERAELGLSTIMSQHPHDIVANVMFNLSLKYKGKALNDISGARYHVSLTPVKIFPHDLSDYSIDPMPAGLTVVSDAELPEGSRATKRLVDLIGRLGVDDSSKSGSG
jgi:hypothetical protein